MTEATQNTQWEYSDATASQPVTIDGMQITSVRNGVARILCFRDDFLPMIRGETTPTFTRRYPLMLDIAVPDLVAISKLLDDLIGNLVETNAIKKEDVEAIRRAQLPVKKSTQHNT